MYRVSTKSALWTYLKSIWNLKLNFAVLKTETSKTAELDELVLKPVCMRKG